MTLVHSQNLTSYSPVYSQYTVPGSDNPAEMFTGLSSYNHLSQQQNLVILPPSSRQQEPYPIITHNNPSSPLIVCRWLYYDRCCGHEATSKTELNRHWKITHRLECQDAWIQCLWEGCDYHRRGDPSVRVMRRSCVWRHIHEVHLGHRRST